MSSKLGMSGAYNRARDVYASSKTSKKNGGDIQHESARITALENQITSMREENSNLKKELLELRQTVRQIFSENSHEKFDERRINMIKFQVIQLERQISLLTDALGSRSDAILEVENSMTCLADTMRSYLASEVQGSMISISKKDLIALIELSESSRIKLFKCIENVNKDEVGKELLILNPFLAGKGKGENSLSLLDISLHGLDYLNLRRVSQTESKLCSLYKELIRIHTQLEYLQGKGDNNLLLTAHIAHGEMERTRNSLLKTCVIIKDVADDLLAVSLLCPSAPWPVLKNPISKEISVERVIEALPPLPSSKQEELNQVITASLGVCNHQLHLKEKEKSALKEEIAFHQMIYDLQMQYTQAVLDAIRKGYTEFEDTVRNFLSRPVKSLLEAYEHLKNSASEKALRNILLIFKTNETQLSSIVEMLDIQDSDDESQGSKALSSFGEEFMKRVDSLVKSHKKQVERTSKEKVEVREEQKRLATELSHLIEELESKYEKQWIPGYKKNKTLTSEEINSVMSSRIMKDTDSCAENIDFSCDVSSNSPNSSGLRTYLDEDYKRSEDMQCTSKSQKSNQDKDREKSLFPNKLLMNAQDAYKCEFTHKSNTLVHEKVDDCEQLHKSNKNSRKKGSQVPWKPQKKWVDDFSVSRCTPLSDDTDNLLSSSSQQAGLSRENSWQNDQRSDVVSLPQLVKKRVKKKEMSYEPNLNVAQRSLNLKRSEDSLRTDLKDDQGGNFKDT